jgi:hypothetical protein
MKEAGASEMMVFKLFLSWSTTLVTAPGGLTTSRRVGSVQCGQAPAFLVYNNLHPLFSKAKREECAAASVKLRRVSEGENLT